VIEGTLLVNGTSAAGSAQLSAVFVEIKGGRLVIASTDSGGRVVGPYNGNFTLTLMGTNPRLESMYGLNPRQVPALSFGREGVRLAAGSLGIFGEFTALGRASTNSWTKLASTSEAGSQQVEVDGSVNWPEGAEIVLAPSDFDPHEAEVRRLAAPAMPIAGTTRTLLTLTTPLSFRHYGGTAKGYGTRTLRIAAAVGLLSRNIVIRGGGQGEDQPYTAWNAPSDIAGDAPTCGNQACELGEDSRGCPADCKGPAYEYGAAVLVGRYTDDGVVCGKDGSCETGYRRSYIGSINSSRVELRYFGHNGNRAGLTFDGLGTGGANCLVRGWAWNRGYHGAVMVRRTHNATVQDGVIFRSMLPAVSVEGGAATGGTWVEGVLAVVGIYWHTHRGSIQV
jgi:hypothetical protein